jgi:hypothetical protein
MPLDSKNQTQTEVYFISMILQWYDQYKAIQGTDETGQVDFSGQS